MSRIEVEGPQGNLLSNTLLEVRNMDLIESRTHSFIVTVWLEETAEEAGKAIWRGHITHVTSKERQYFQTLGAVPAIIAPYLEEMGVKLSIFWRVRRWFRIRGR